jgi:hypothetical protein
MKNKKSNEKRIKPQLEFQDKSPFSDQLVQVRVHSKRNPLLTHQLNRNQEILLDLKKKMYTDGLIAEMNYEEGMFHTKHEERAKYEASMNKAKQRYSAGLFTLSDYNKKLQNIEQKFEQDMMSRQNTLESDFICELISEQLDAARRNSKN